VNENRTDFPRTRRRLLPQPRCALRPARKTKKNWRFLKKPLTNWPRLLVTTSLCPSLEEEIARQQAARREAEAERDELLAQNGSFDERGLGMKRIEVRVELDEAEAREFMDLVHDSRAVLDELLKEVRCTSSASCVR
jgi:hypothetical protein